MASAYDDWLMKQADNYYDRSEDHEEDSEWCQCRACKEERRIEYEEARADAEYDAMRERQLFGI